jgi:Uncharacterized conserved protein
MRGARPCRAAHALLATFYDRAMNDPLSQVSHRPYPLPKTPWVMRQTWDNLLFAHWPVPAGAMRRVLPPQLEPDLFEGQTWLGVVPFTANSDLTCAGQ